MKKVLRTSFIFCLIALCNACGFHIQGEAHLAPPLHNMYLQTGDPYGQLARSLQQYLKVSKVHLVSSPAEASTTLSILREDLTQDLLSVNGTQQTRQYVLHVTVTFEITKPNGQIIVGPQTLTESRVITVQSNQVLGSSNESNLFYQQMRRMIAYGIINRIASKEITEKVESSFNSPTSTVKP